MRRLLWLGVFAVAGCSALSKPVTDPATGEPVVNPATGETVTAYDQITGTLGGLASILGANPLWGTLVGAGAALARDKVVKKP